MIKEHETTRVRGEPRDFVDCYLDKLDMVCVCAGIRIIIKFTKDFMFYSIPY